MFGRRKPRPLTWTSPISAGMRFETFVSVYLQLGRQNSFDRSTLTAPRATLKVHALLRLQMSQNAKHVLRRGVAVRSEHPHEAGGRDGGRLFQPPESDRGVDV